MLPCGLPSGSDLFVRGAEPQPVPAGAAVAAASAVYAKEGSAIAASQAKMGENSYYYSVGRNLPTVAGTGHPEATRQPKARAVVPRPLKEQTISQFSMTD